jgi:hypothetical protein
MDFDKLTQNDIRELKRELKQETRSVKYEITKDISAIQSQQESSKVKN